MAHPLNKVVQHIRRVAARQGATDGELLQAFLTSDDQAAFTALVRRHGPLVLAVCKRVLGNLEDAEDALQATFVVLARRAAKLPHRCSLSTWLHGVAYRIALNARRLAAHRRRHESQAHTMASTNPTWDAAWREVQLLLDEEIHRLQEKYREPFILCCLEGQSYAAAAQQMGVKESTVHGRLAEARKRLQARLSRRGVELTAVLGAVAVAPSAMTAQVAPALVAKAVSAATSAAVPASVSALVKGLTASLAIKKAKVGAVLFVILSAMVGTTSMWALNKEAAGQERTPLPLAAGKHEAAVQAEPAIAKDIYGDPLPDGALARLGARRLRFDGNAVGLAYTPDGKTLVGRSDSSVILWDAATGAERRRLRGPLQTLLFGKGMAISPDGTSLAIANSGHRVEPKLEIWELETGKVVRTLSLPNGERADFFSHVCFSPDGTRLVWGSPSKVVVFDLASGQMRVSMGGQDSLALYDFAVSPDNKTLAAAVRAKDAKSAGMEHGVQLWDLSSGKMMRTVQELPTNEEDKVQGLVFSQDNKLLAFAFQNQVYLSDPSSGTKLKQLNIKEGKITDVAFAPDGKKLVTTDSNGQALAWDLTTSRILHTFEGTGLPSFSPDGRTLAVAFGRSVRLRDMRTGKELCNEYDGHQSRIWELAFSPDGKELVSAEIESRDSDNQVFFWDTATNRRKGTLPWSARSLSFSRDGKLLATVPLQSRTMVRIWNRSAGKEELKFTVPGAEYVTAAVFSPDGRKLFTWDQPLGPSGNGRLRRWDLATAKEEQLWLVPDRGNIRDYLTLTPHAMLVHADSQSGGIKIFDKEWARERTFEGMVAPMRSAAASPDGRFVAAGVGVDDREVHIWEIATGKRLLVLKGNQGSPGPIAWSPNGRLVAGGDRRTSNMQLIGLGKLNLQYETLAWQQYTKNLDQGIVIWDTATGKLVTRFGGFQADVFSLAFSPDGTRLAAGLGDSTILVWDISKTELSPAPKLGPEELIATWTQLGSLDAAVGNKAAWALVLSPKEAVPFLKNHLQPVPLVDKEIILNWIRDLNSDIFAVRQAASQNLEGLAIQAKPHLEKALSSRPTVETRVRLEQILKALSDVPGAGTLRSLRAIMALERIGSPEAQAVLEKLANGAPGARETVEAKASLERLNQRASKLP